jgi:hypothetical protein
MNCVKMFHSHCYLITMVIRIQSLCSKIRVNIHIFSVDKKTQLDVTFVFFISLLLVAQHVSGNHVPIIRSWWLCDVIVSCWYVPWLQEGCQDFWILYFSSTSCSHGTYQHEAITSHSRQLLMMGTWLPETCWATSRREIKNTRVTSSWLFLFTLN